jgi:3',5'-cyclic AMP phosphodiesterase CpdA
MKTSFQRFESRLILAALGIGGFLALVPAVAQNALSGVKKVEDSVQWRATAVPDRIILTFEADPATTQSVTWRTSPEVAPGQAVAQVAPASAYPKFGDAATTVTAQSEAVAGDLGAFHSHSARFTGLKPKTQYAYRVGDGANWSEWIHFTTASDKSEPFSFIYFGDAQNDLKSLWSRAIRSAYAEAPKARFMIHAGDLINNSGNDAQWGEWFYAGGWVNSMMPSLPTPGNHEYGSGKTLDYHWRPQFALPTNGPQGLEETCYFVDYQGVRIVSLNTEEKQAEQAQWLDNLLAQNRNRWTILTFHRPMFSSAKGRDNKELRALWMPVFDKHKVDLVLQGHDHTYARSQNVRAGVNVRDSDSGTVYVVSVSGPKMYNLEREPWMRRAAENTQLYQVINVDNDTLRYEARTVTGELYDAFELKKGRNGQNRLNERAPKTTEYLSVNKTVPVPR